MEDNEALPLPSRVRKREPPSRSPHLAAKAAVYTAWKEAGVSKSELARRLRRNETEVRRILDPHHGTKLDQLEEAARALGKAGGVVRGCVTMNRHHAIAFSPFVRTRLSSFSEAPSGRFSPRSHLLTMPLLTLR